MKWREEELKEKVAEICRAGGIPSADAAMIAEVLLSLNGCDDPTEIYGGAYIGRCHAK